MADWEEETSDCVEEDRRVLLVHKIRRSVPITKFTWRSLSFRAEDHDVPVPADAVCLILAGGLHLLVIFTASRVLKRTHIRRRGGEEESADAEVAEEQDDQWDEAPKV